MNQELKQEPKQTFFRDLDRDRIYYIYLRRSGLPEPDEEWEVYVEWGRPNSKLASRVISFSFQSGLRKIRFERHGYYFLALRAYEELVERKRYSRITPVYDEEAEPYQQHEHYTSFPRHDRV